MTLNRKAIAGGKVRKIFFKSLSRVGEFRRSGKSGTHSDDYRISRIKCVFQSFNFFCHNFSPLKIKLSSDLTLIHKSLKKITFIIITDFCFGKITINVKNMSDFWPVFASVDMNDRFNALAF